MKLSDQDRNWRNLQKRRKTRISKLELGSDSFPQSIWFLEELEGRNFWQGLSPIFK